MARSAWRSSGVKLLVRLTVSDERDLAVVFKVLQNLLVGVKDCLVQLILGQLTNFFQMRRGWDDLNDHPSSFKTRSNSA